MVVAISEASSSESLFSGVELGVSPRITSVGAIGPIGTSGLWAGVDSLLSTEAGLGVLVADFGVLFDFSFCFLELFKAD